MDFLSAHCSLSSLSDMYTAAGEYLKAVDIMAENRWVDRYVPGTRQSMCDTILHCD